MVRNCIKRRNGREKVALRKTSSFWDWDKMKAKLCSQFITEEQSQVNSRTNGGWWHMTERRKEENEHSIIHFGFGTECKEIVGYIFVMSANYELNVIWKYGNERKHMVQVHFQWCRSFAKNRLLKKCKRIWALINYLTKHFVQLTCPNFSTCTILK